MAFRNNHPLRFAFGFYVSFKLKSHAKNHLGKVDGFQCSSLPHRFQLVGGGITPESNAVSPAVLNALCKDCLLYTSDAADDLLTV